MDTDIIEITNTTRRSYVPQARLVGLIAFVAVFSTGCTLSDVSSILSILRLFGIL